MELSESENRKATGYIRRATSLIKGVKNKLGLGDWEFFVECRPGPFMPNPNALATIHSELGVKRAHLLVNLDQDPDGNVLYGGLEEIILHELVHVILHETGVSTLEDEMDEEMGDRLHGACDVLCDRMAKIIGGLLD